MVKLFDSLKGTLLAFIILLGLDLIVTIIGEQGVLWAASSDVWIGLRIVITLILGGLLSIAAFAKIFLWVAGIFLVGRILTLQK